MNKKHRYATHELNAIKHTLIKHMVDGKFGYVPTKGSKGSRTPDGGFYVRVQKHVTKVFGYPIGHGTINKCKERAAKILAKQNTPATFSRPTPTKEISPRLMLRRLTGKGTLRQQAFVEGMKASYATKVKGGTAKDKALTPKEIVATISLYKKLFGK